MNYFALRKKGMPRAARTGLCAIFVLATFSLLAMGVPLARAETPQIFIPVALAPVQRDSPIELVALTVDVEIHESGGHTLLTGNSTFKLHNSDRLNDLQVPVGFPTWAGDPFAFDPARLDAFSVSVEGKKVTLTPSRADLKIDNAVRSVDWFTFTLPIAGDEKKTVRLDYQQDLGDGALPRITYGLVTSTGWKGNIGSARLTIRFPDITTLEQIVAYDPPNPTFDGSSLTWLFQNYEPPANLTLTILRPSLWNDLLAKRRAARQNPNDANARTALGNLLRQLALSDSPRSDSFFAQAVAELETAVRLDPNQRSARQSLAMLYEARAGPPAGPRRTAYVLLAVAQWEPLVPTDANARKQLAEDYFYLGVDAQTRGAFADAQNYFDQASPLAPNGAGPLFTPEHATAQRRALNLAWARALLDKNDFASAESKARAALGDAFIASFKPPAFYVTRVQVNMSPLSRGMVFTLTPFASQPAELQNSLSGLITLLRNTGAGVTLSSTDSDLALTITVPFRNQADLSTRLDALARITSDRADGSLVQGVLSPNELVWEERDNIVAQTTRYREQVDLSPACNAFSAQLDAVTQNLAPLENVSANDEEGQLKRALLKNAQSGWQQALSQARVTYRLGTNESQVDACTARTIDLSTIALHTERVIVLIGMSVIVIGDIVLLVLWLRSRRGRG